MLLRPSSFINRLAAVTHPNKQPRKRGATPSPPVSDVAEKAAELARWLDDDDENLRSTQNSARVAAARALIKALIADLEEYLQSEENTPLGRTFSKLLAAMTDADMEAGLRDAPFEKQEALVSAKERAQTAEYRQVIFGEDKPTVARFRRWLAAHVGDDFGGDDKVLVARAIQHYRKELRLKLLFQGEAGKPVECTISTNRQIGEYQRRFRVMATGRDQRPLYQRNGLPLLDVEPA